MDPPIDFNSARQLGETEEESVVMKPCIDRNDPELKAIPNLAWSTFTGKTGQTLVYGSYIDYDERTGDDSECRMRDVQRRMNLMGLKPPFMAMDLSYIEQLGLKLDTDVEIVLDAATKKDRKPVRIVVSACDIADMIDFATLGNSRVRVHRETPQYRWFHCINLQLQNIPSNTRVIPFPIENTKPGPNGEKEVFFQVLPVTPAEYNLYEQVLHANLHSGGLAVDPNEAFALTAKMSYEILSRRGLTELTHSQVDQFLIHVIISKQLSLRGVLIRNWEEDDFEESNRFGIWL